MNTTIVALACAAVAATATATPTPTRTSTSTSTATPTSTSTATLATPAPGEPAPPRLADTGLYADPRTRAVAADVLPYSPQYPLWSDGATKRRWIWLPPGASIDAADADAWDFPPGTRLWKEFSFGRRVETRYMARRADGSWIYATYAWAEDGADASLAPERGLRGAAEIRPGLRHDVPGHHDCTACHEGAATPVLGFAALQLSPDRDPLAPHAEAPPPGAVDLAALVRRGLVRGLPAELQARAPRVAARTPRERAALGYLHGNCSGCHNPHGPLASLGLDLEQRVAPGATPSLATAVERPSRFHLAVAGGEASTRIAPGDPAGSVLLGRVASTSPLARMPPLGTAAVDEQARDLLAGWIAHDLPARRAGRIAEAPKPHPAQHPRTDQEQ